jgi:hypothetical protein
MAKLLQRLCLSESSNMILLDQFFRLVALALGHARLNDASVNLPVTEQLVASLDMLNRRLKDRQGQRLDCSLLKNLLTKVTTKVTDLLRPFEHKPRQQRLITSTLQSQPQNASDVK